MTNRSWMALAGILSFLIVTACDDGGNTSKPGEAREPEQPTQDAGTSESEPQTPVETETPKDDEGQTETESPVCGNGLLEAGEACDGEIVEASCSEFDALRAWLDGGRPGCSATCELEQGSCEEVKSPVCGNGLIEAGEVCDGTQGVPDTCEAFDGTKKWVAGGVPSCDEACGAITRGSCEVVGQREISFMNWNVQVDYASWGGKPVDDRAKVLNDIMTGWEKTPDIFAIVEAAPNWHRPDISKYFEDMGYAWADAGLHETWVNWTDGFTCGENNENAFNDTTTNNATLQENHAASCFFFTDVLYKKDKFELLEANYIKLFPPTDWDGLPENCTLHIRGDVCSTYDPNSLYCVNKTISFAAVLKEKETGVVFIAVSNHWNPNNGVKTDVIPASIFGPVADNELVRVYGAEQASEFIKSLQAKYEGAHVIFGGDFNTIDFNIIYETPATSSLLGSNIEELIASINKFLVGEYEADMLQPDFVGSHEVFGKLSGLLDARTQAKTALDDFVDNDTAIEEDIAKYTSPFGLRLIIDYTFYSPTLTLTYYEVPTGTDYQSVSDHAPVKTTYLYEVPD